MAEELAPRVVLNAIVRSIERHADGTITVGSDGGDVTAKAVILAIPPAHRAGIEFITGAARRVRANSRSIGRRATLSKAYAAYETPFWRANGCSGEALSDEGPVFITFDVSPDEKGPGILLGFTDPRTFDPLPPEQRRERALAGFAALFGDEALQPIDYVDHCWGTEDFAPGGPTAAVPPGSWTTYGPWLRKPVERIFWAGTETADEWTGFLDGAVRSGRRAAAEVHRELSGYARRLDPPSRRCLAGRLDEPAQLPVDLLGALQDRAVPTGQLDELRQVGRHPRDVARRDHRQQPILLAADHQRRHREVLQPDVLVRPQRIDQRAGPAAAARGRRGGEQLVDELGDRRDPRRGPPPSSTRTACWAGPTARSRGAAPKVLSRVPAARTLASASRGGTGMSWT